MQTGVEGTWNGLAGAPGAVDLAAGAELNLGSEWRRWGPHIHASGMTMTNQFTGPTAWED